MLLQICIKEVGIYNYYLKEIQIIRHINQIITHPFPQKKSLKYATVYSIMLILPSVVRVQSRDMALTGASRRRTFISI